MVKRMRMFIRSMKNKVNKKVVITEAKLLARWRLKPTNMQTNR